MSRPKASLSFKTSYTPAKIIGFKRQALRLLESCECTNLTQVADKINLPRTLLYRWKRDDPDWQKELDLCNEIIADKLEQELELALVEGRAINQPYVTARIVRLKALRPNKYREKLSLDVTDNKTRELLAELRSAKDKPDPKPEEIVQGG